MQNVKPGFLTSEFWSMIGTILVNVVVALVLAGAIGEGDADSLSDALGGAATGLGALVINGWVIVRYIQQRTAIKSSSAIEPAFELDVSEE